MRVLIVGAAGRDFHDFLARYRDDAATRVVAFTAAQIPYIDDRRFPAALAGPRYPDGIPIRPESELEDIVREHDVEQVVFAYSDVTWEHVRRIGLRARAAGADLVIPGTRTMLPSRRPVLAVGAVRTGCGKSQVVRYLLDLLDARGVRAVGIRHPMPYGDLVAQAVQRFATDADLDRHRCTIEEREEYEPYLERGRVVYAGVDYASILAAAEQEAEVILWDGGNNDLPLIRPDLHVVLADPHRPAAATTHYPSGLQMALADLVLIAKSNTATAEAIAAERSLAGRLAPGATVIAVDSRMSSVEVPEGDLAGRRVVCVEDGPTTTHGGMAYGAAVLLARRAGAVVVDPRPFFAGTLRKTLADYPDIGPLVPAVGYSPEQRADLEATLRACDAELVLSGTPIDFARLVSPGKPVVRVRYDLAERDGEPAIADVVDAWLASRSA